MCWCADNASPNQSAFTATLFEGQKTNNPFSGEPLYMIPCLPHTIKTTRNAWESSSNASYSTRKLVRRGVPIVWQHLRKLYNQDAARTI